MTAGLLHVIDFIWSALRTTEFWSAVQAIGTVLALWFIYRQIAVARHTAAYQFLTKKDEDFATQSMQEDRTKLALALLAKAPHRRLETQADVVLGYFEDLGLLLEKGVAPIHFVWTTHCYYVIRYWHVLEEHVRWIRDNKGDTTYYREFESLYKKMARYEQKMTGRSVVTPSNAGIRSFLIDELHISVRTCCSNDLERITVIEEGGFSPIDAYSREKFEALLQEHSEGVTVQARTGLREDRREGTGRSDGAGDPWSAATQACVT